MPDVLVLYASAEGHTARIAQRIAEHLGAGGHRVDVARAGGAVDASRYAGIVVGASVHYGHHPAWLAKWLKSFELGHQPSAFFSVSLSAKERYAASFLRKARWRPALTAVFAGALSYSQYKPLKRLVVRALAAVAGHDTDTSRDYEYTDWKAVERFARAFSETLTSAS